MAHFLRPTFNSLHNHMPNLNCLTLASHNKPKSSRSSSMSPLQSSSQPNPFLPPSRLAEENNDFQSNARNGTTHSSFSGSRFAGLGITYPERFLHYTEEDCEEAYTLDLSPATNVLQTHLDDENVQSHDPLSDLLPSTPWSPAAISGPTSEAIDLTCPLSQGATLQYPHLDGATEIAFSSIAAASGMSIDILAQQLSATADLALQYMAEDPYCSFSALGSSASRSEGSLLDELLEDRHTSWPALVGNKDGITPGPEIEVYSEAWMETPLAVNPADTVYGTLSQTDPPQNPFLPSSSAVSNFASINIFDVLLSTKTETRDDEQLRLANDIDVHQEQVAVYGHQAAHHDVFLPTKTEGDNSDYELSDHGYSSSSSFPSPRQKKRAKCSKSTAQRPIGKPKQKIQRTVEKLVREPAPVKAEELSLNLDLGTPVLNAHRGITLEDLKSKAERYRLRNAGRMYDNAWLVSFVGKLSSRGELVEEYRCYVDGCPQTNKRRDHILIHVGSHLDQRPYACAFCPSQFLRKNECKRHELSHSGTKPYVCDLCPDAAFVRQDLLRRHAARAHGIITARKRKSDAVKEEEKENNGIRPSKRVTRKVIRKNEV